MTNGTSLETIALHDAGLPARALHVLENVKSVQTVADVEKMTDEKLLKMKALGPKTVQELRERIELLKSGKVDNITIMAPTTHRRNSREMEWASEHQALIKAIMDGEVALIAK